MDNFDPAMDAGFFNQAPPPMDGRGAPRPHLRFYTEAKEMPGKSVEAGRPIYENVDYVAITNPGSRDVLVREAEDKAKTDEYVAWAYKRWKATQQEVVDGTPLETVPFLTKSQVMELKALNVMSLEGLAALSDTAKQRFMGAHDLSKKAQAYMKSAKDTATATKLQKELDERDLVISAMKKQMEEMNKRYEELAKKVQ